MAWKKAVKWSLKRRADSKKKLEVQKRSLQRQLRDIEKFARFSGTDRRRFVERSVGRN